MERIFLNKTTNQSKAIFTLLFVGLSVLVNAQQNSEVKTETNVDDLLNSNLAHWLLGIIFTAAFAVLVYLMVKDKKKKERIARNNLQKTQSLKDNHRRKNGTRIQTS